MNNARGAHCDWCCPGQVQLYCRSAQDLTTSELHRLEPRVEIQEAERNVIQSFVHGPPREDNCPLTPQAVVVIASGAILATEGVAANLRSHTEQNPAQNVHA